MRIQKLLTVICVATLLGSLSLKAQRTDSEAQAKAREATRVKVKELNDIGAPTTPPYYESHAETNETIEPTRKAEREKIDELNAKEGHVNPDTLISPKRISDEQEAQTIAALHKAEAQDGGQPHHHVMAHSPEASTPPMPPPVNLVPGSKEQRLATLLDLYRADRISPAEYHAQRAKVISEP